MSDILNRIVARTRERMASEAPDADALRSAARHAAERRKPHAFSAALRRDVINIIAEIKSASPSAGSIVDNPDVETIAAEYARGGAAAISVVTEADFFQGSRDWIARASSATQLPVIMKDFIVEEAQLYAAIATGADAVLLLASLLDAGQIVHFTTILGRYGCDALVEVHDDEELDRAIRAGATLIGVNNRDLRTFQVDLATSERLIERIPADAIRVTESGIHTHEDVRRLRSAGFHAFLVGESLLRQNDRAAAVRRLVEGVNG